MGDRMRKEIKLIVIFSILFLFVTSLNFSYASKEDFENDNQKDGISIADVQDAFNKVDKNNDGILSKEEIESNEVDDIYIINLANGANMPSTEINGSGAQAWYNSNIKKNKDVIINEYNRRRENYGLEEQETSIEDREEDEEDEIYTAQPSRNDTGRNASSSINDLMADAESFVDQGDTSQLPASNLQDFSSVIYNILLTVGIVVAVIVGAIIGVKLMASNIDTKVEAKKLLIPYVVGCVVVFGAFAIWKIVVTMLQGM